MPARQKPVAKRSARNSHRCSGAASVSALQAAPTIAEPKNRRWAAMRSDSARMAKTVVPAMKPSCTLEVSQPVRPTTFGHSVASSGTTALGTNHSEAPRNWDTTMRGRTRALRSGGESDDGTATRTYLRRGPTSTADVRRSQIDYGRT